VQYLSIKKYFAFFSFRLYIFLVNNFFHFFSKMKRKTLFSSLGEYKSQRLIDQQNFRAFENYTKDTRSIENIAKRLKITQPVEWQSHSQELLLVERNSREIHAIVNIDGVETRSERIAFEEFPLQVSCSLVLMEIFKLLSQQNYLELDSFFALAKVCSYTRQLFNSRQFWYEKFNGAFLDKLPKHLPVWHSLSLLCNPREIGEYAENGQEYSEEIEQLRLDVLFVDWGMKPAARSNDIVHKKEPVVFIGRKNITSNCFQSNMHKLCGRDGKHSSDIQFSRKLFTKFVRAKVEQNLTGNYSKVDLFRYLKFKNGRSGSTPHVSNLYDFENGKRLRLTCKNCGANNKLLETVPKTHRPFIYRVGRQKKLCFDCCMRCLNQKL